MGKEEEGSVEGGEGWGGGGKRVSSEPAEVVAAYLVYLAWCQSLWPLCRSVDL